MLFEWEGTEDLTKDALDKYIEEMVTLIYYFQIRVTSRHPLSNKPSWPSILSENSQHSAVTYTNVNHCRGVEFLITDQSMHAKNTKKAQRKGRKPIVTVDVDGLLSIYS